MEQDLELGLLELPLPDFLQKYGELLEEDLDLWSEEDDGLFRLVRAVKAHPATRVLPPDQAYAKVRQAMDRFGIEQLKELGLDTEDGEVAFHGMWARVRFPLGTDPIEAACAMAGDGVIRTQNVRPGRYARFLTVAGLIQFQVRQRSILLPVRKVARHFPCQPNTVTSWIGWAIDDGVLIKSAHHAFRSQGGSLAAEYVFGLHCWGKKSHEDLGKLLRVPFRPADVEWTAEQFGQVSRA